MFKVFLRAALGLVLALVGFVGLASAGPIIVPVSFSVSSPDPFGPTLAEVNILDQTGLSATYVPGVTDFDTFVASTTASNTGLAVVGGTGAPPSYFEFDFGGLVSVDAIAIWNQYGTASLDSFTVETSALADFSVSQVFGTFAMSIVGGANVIGADVFAFSSADFRYLRINNLTNAGFDRATRINEIVFRQSDGDGGFDAIPVPVPEPASLALFGFGLAGLGLSRRRKRVA